MFYGQAKDFDTCKSICDVKTLVEDKGYNICNIRLCTVQGLLVLNDTDKCKKEFVRYIIEKGYKYDYRDYIPATFVSRWLHRNGEYQLAEYFRNLQIHNNHFDFVKS